MTCVGRSASTLRDFCYLTRLVLYSYSSVGVNSKGVRKWSYHLVETTYSSSTEIASCLTCRTRCKVRSFTRQDQDSSVLRRESTMRDRRTDANATSRRRWRRCSVETTRGAGDPQRWYLTLSAAQPCPRGVSTRLTVPKPIGRSTRTYADRIHLPGMERLAYVGCVGCVGYGLRTMAFISRDHERRHRML